MIILWWEFRQLKAADRDRRESARYILGIRPDSTEYLLNALSDQDWETRAWAAQALGKRKQKDALPALVGALRDGHGKVRNDAAWSLGEIGDPAASDALASICTRNAALALARMGDRRYLLPLLRCLEERFPPGQ